MAKRKRKSTKQNRSPRPWRWVWLLLGILIGGILVGTLATKITDTWQKVHSTATAVKVQQKPCKVAKKQDFQGLEFDFYKLLPDGVVAKLQPKKPKSTATTGKHVVQKVVYIVRVGSFRKLREADELKARLTLSGFSPRINKIILSDRKTWYRVQLGPIKTEKSAMRWQQKLRQQHLNGVIVQQNIR
ncbi:MAG: hypothetical protein COC15_00280 [Legionellales bacterium]|nr:MAG: hypothetical protein COC15_00280 [Legionellales bacterium]